MKLNPEAKYPSLRAYVLKLRGDATADVIVGRIENIVTGRQREFASADDLLRSIASDLGSAPAGRPADDDGEPRDGDRTPTQP